MYIYLHQRLTVISAAPLSDERLSLNSNVPKGGPIVVLHRGVQTMHLLPRKMKCAIAFDLLRTTDRELATFFDFVLSDIGGDADAFPCPSIVQVNNGVLKHDRLGKGSSVDVIGRQKQKRFGIQRWNKRCRL